MPGSVNSVLLVNPHTTSARRALLLPPCYRWGSRVNSNLPEDVSAEVVSGQEVVIAAFVFLTYFFWNHLPVEYEDLHIPHWPNDYKNQGMDWMKIAYLQIPILYFLLSALPVPLQVLKRSWLSKQAGLLLFRRDIFFMSAICREIKRKHKMKKALRPPSLLLKSF